ncbi:MAG: glycoside hydrolase family 2 [Spirochaetes bacterium]|nr:glycoside hydrolase family 2 [Spirochaetota bacterium]
MKNEKNPYENILTRDPWEHFTGDYITADTWLDASFRRRESLAGEWNYTEDPYNNCLRSGWYNFSTSESIYRTYRSQFPAFGIDEKEFTVDLASQMDLLPMVKQLVPLDFDFDLWPVMNLPCCWNMSAEKYFLYEGSMVFTRTFRHSRKEDERAFLRIDGANYRCAVFLGGFFIGSHRGGGGDFFIEITERLKPGDNRIIIVVDNTRRLEQVPMINTDWFNYGGLYRGIDIVYTPDTFIRHFFLTLIPDGTMKNIRCSVTLDRDVDGKCLLEVPELGEPVSIPIRNGFGEVFFSRKPEPWSPKNPKIYDVAITFGEDRITDRIGFREIRVEKDRILLNGRDIFLKGISTHEESVVNGRSLSPEEVRENLTLVKELGGNFLRLAHYPHSGMTSRMADRMGVLLWEEIPVYWAIQFENPDTLADAKNQLEELILRDRNRASVVIWSVGNENEDTERRFTFMENLVKCAKELDDSRLVSAACLVNWEENSVQDSLSKVLDVIGINEYFGWYLPGIERVPRLFDEASVLGKPFIVSETGAGALAGKRGNENEFFTEEKQRKVYEDQTAAIRKCPNIRGMTPWILYDFRTPLRTNVFQNKYNLKGLLTADKKRRKQAFYTLKSFYEELD